MMAPPTRFELKPLAEQKRRDQLWPDEPPRGLMRRLQFLFKKKVRKIIDSIPTGKFTLTRGSRGEDIQSAQYSVGLPGSGSGYGLCRVHVACCENYFTATNRILNCNIYYHGARNIFQFYKPGTYKGCKQDA